MCPLIILLYLASSHFHTWFADGFYHFTCVHLISFLCDLKIGSLMFFSWVNHGSIRITKNCPLTLSPLCPPSSHYPPSPYKRDPAKDLKNSDDSKELKDYRDCCHFTPGCDFEISNNKAEFREIIVLLLFAAIFLWVLLSHGLTCRNPRDSSPRVSDGSLRQLFPLSPPSSSAAYMQRQWLKS